MTKVYVDWKNEEILSEREMEEMYRDMLDLERDFATESFERFCENCDYVKVLIEIITAKDKQEVLDSIEERYGRYIEDQLNDIYEEITLDISGV